MKNCNQCGKCCVKYGSGGLSASASEIQYWDEARPNIYRYVSDGKIWMSPENGQQLARCPWLRKESDQDKYTCDIYHDRPDDCSYYPVTIQQMMADECEMLEPMDLKNLKQAQQAVDKLMVDSRPPVG